MSEDELFVLTSLLAVTFIGYPAGHNHYAWGEFEWKDRFIDGVVVDGLLRSGYLEAVKLPEEELPAVEVAEDPDAPDIQGTHEIRLSEKGRKWLSENVN